MNAWKRIPPENRWLVFLALSTAFFLVALALGGCGPNGKGASKAKQKGLPVELHNPYPFDYPVRVWYGAPLPIQLDVPANGTSKVEVVGPLGGYPNAVGIECWAFGTPQNPVIGWPIFTYQKPDFEKKKWDAATKKWLSLGFGIELTLP